MGKLAVFVLLLSLPAWAQSGPTAQKFLANVKGWTGSLDIHGTGSGTIAGQAGATAQYKTDMHTSGILTLDSFNTLTNSWVGALNGTIVITEQSIVSLGCTVTSTFTADTSAQIDGNGQPLTWNLTPDNGADTWSLWPSNDTVKGVDTAVTDCAGQTSTTSADMGLRFAEISFKMGFPFPSSGYDLKDTRTYHCTGCGNANSNPVDFTYTYDLKANTSQPSITVATNPGGLRITVDGASLLSPQTFNWDPGSTHTIGTTSPQGAGTLYTFDSWSDGGNQTHTITTPASNTTYTARFNAQYLLTAVISPDNAGTVTADPCCVNGYFDNGSDVKVTAAPACGFQFSNWTGDLTGVVNPGTVHIIQPTTITANFTALAGGCTNPKAQLTSPSPGSTLGGSSATFTWGAISGASGYWLSVGSVAGGGDIYAGSAVGGTSITLLNLPTDGRNIYVRLGTLETAVWQYIDSVFKAAGSSTGATMVTPTPGSTLSGSGVTFTWTSVSGAPGYVLAVGSTPQGSDYFYQQGSATSQAVSGLPADGSTVYVQLGTLNASGVVQWSDYTYRAAGTLSKAAMTIPTPGASLSGSSVTFTWSAGSGAAAYWLDVGTNPGGFDIFSQSTGLSTSQTVSAIPTDGSTIYVRLWTAFAGNWQFNDYTYTASTVPTKAVMINPPPGSGLTGSTVTFTWNPDPAAAAYWLDIGTTSAGFDIFSQSAGLSTSQAVTGLPTDGSTVYVRLWTANNGTWLYNDYTYTEAGGLSKAVMITPAPGSTLAGTKVPFTWSAGPGASAYWLDIGTTAAGFDLFSQSAGQATSQAVAGLPTGGVSIYVRLWTALGGLWQYNDYTYKAGN